MSLESLLPGERTVWFCEESDEVCGMDPIAYSSFLVLLLANINFLSERVLFSVTIFFVLNSTSFFVLPAIFTKLFILGVLFTHLPALTPPQSKLFLLLSVTFFISNATNMVPTFHIIFFTFSFYSLINTIYINIYTFLASNPGPLFFPIVQHIVPRYSFSPEDFFKADSPPTHIAQRRMASFDMMKRRWDAKFSNGLAISSELAKTFSDLRFTGGNRVFLPFMQMLSTWCDPCTVVVAAEGPTLVDVDGNELIDISGSYGVNVCGYEKYKEFITEGWKSVSDLGCVLGPIHPLLVENINMLRSISRKEEVSFHMSGTEAVMCAIRLCRFNTSKTKAVVFSGAYHGWWDGVQPLAGNDRSPNDVITLKDMNPLSLTAIGLRKSEIACVVVNPLQAFHPNSPPPSDLTLASNLRSAQKGESATEAYKIWLGKLRDVCSRHAIPLVFDEVYTGFRLAPGGAQEYFGVDADMVVYGKSLGGGIPNGAVCGPHSLMKRADETKPLRQAYVIGTFSAHPLLLGAMNSFLKYIISDEARQKYVDLRSLAANWVEQMNKELEAKNVDLRLQTYASVWTMLFVKPGRYHWMLQYYLKDEGANLSWVGTGRLSFSHDFTPEHLEKLKGCIFRACERMVQDGWWWADANQTEEQSKKSDLKIKLSLGSEILRALVKRILGL